MIGTLLAAAALSLAWPWAAPLGAAWAALAAFGKSAPEFAFMLLGALCTGYAALHLRDRRRESLAAMSAFLAGLWLFFNAADWVQLYVAWELAGLSAYVLVMLRSTETARYGARKALLADRASGLLFLAAVAVIRSSTGTFNFTAVPAAAAPLLALAALAKSSQFPFLWLQDSTRTPSPAYALAHAAALPALGPLLLHRFAADFAALAPALETWAVISAVIASLLATAEEDQKRILAYSTTVTAAFLYVVHGSPLLPAAAAVHGLLSAGFFLLLGSYASGAGNYMDMGLDKKSPTSLLAAFLLLSLAGAPLLGLFWFKTQSAASLLTTFLPLLYLLRFHGRVFSGGVRPRRGPGTYLAAAAAALSLAFTPWRAPDVSTVVTFASASIAALAMFRAGITRRLGDALRRLLSFQLPAMEPPEREIENWAYGFGVRFRRAAGAVRSALTGPVSRDVAYVTLALAALALGVFLC